MSGGLWLHRHTWKERAMAHLVSTDRNWLVAVATDIRFPVERLQFKPLKDPTTGVRRDAWHFDLGGPFLPPRLCDEPILNPPYRASSASAVPSAAGAAARRCVPARTSRVST